MPAASFACCGSNNNKKALVVVSWTVGFLGVAVALVWCDSAGQPSWVLPPLVGGCYLAMILTGIVYNLQQDNPLRWCCALGSACCCCGRQSRRRRTIETVTGDQETNLLSQDHLEHQQAREEPEDHDDYGDEDNEDDDQDSERQRQGDVEEATTSSLSPTPALDRLHYLDNLRIFLVAVVITGHAISKATIVFWSGGDASHELPIGMGLKLSFGLIELWVPVVMPCFFAISGYVTPASFQRHGKVAFLRTKRDRLWLPALVVSLTIIPMLIMWDNKFWAHAHKIYYFPWDGPTWFLYTLLVFQWMYCTFQDSSFSNEVAEPQEESSPNPTLPDQPKQPFPSFWKRFCYGFFIAGLVKGVGDLLFPGNEGLNVADWPRHLVLFWAGVQAYNNDWLAPEVMKEHMPTVRKSVMVEVVLLSACLLCSFFVPGAGDNLLLGGGFVSVGGLASLDMTLLLVHCFQEYASTPWSSFWKTSAYAVYLIHLLILFVIADTTANILFERAEESGDSAHDSGETLLTTHQRWFGLVVVVVATHLVSWPMAWGLARLPGFRQVL